MCNEAGADDVVITNTPVHPQTPQQNQLTSKYANQHGIGGSMMSLCAFTPCPLPPHRVRLSMFSTNNNSSGLRGGGRACACPGEGGKGGLGFTCRAEQEVHLGSQQVHLLLARLQVLVAGVHRDGPPGVGLCVLMRWVRLHTPNPPLSSQKLLLSEQVR